MAEALAALHHMLLAGSGNSIRALGRRPDAVANLLARRAPDGIVRTLAAARRRDPSFGIAGVHLFTFGGVASAAQWATALLAARWPDEPEGWPPARGRVMLHHSTASGLIWAGFQSC